MEKVIGRSRSGLVADLAVFFIDVRVSELKNAVSMDLKDLRSLFFLISRRANFTSSFSSRQP